MIWITSDFHFGHEKDFLWQPRGFLSWQEHAEEVIKNFNSVVKPDDVVYVLGDCVLKNDAFGVECLKRLNGKKYLAFGNHDSGARIERYQEEGIFLDIQYGYRLRESKFTFWLQHYPAMMGNYKDKSPTIWQVILIHQINSKIWRMELIISLLMLITVILYLLMKLLKILENIVVNIQ